MVFLELHPHGRKVDNRHRRGGPGPRAHPGRQGPETQLHALAVVIHRIGVREEEKAFGRLRGAESKTRRNRVVGIRSPAVVDSRDGNRYAPLRLLTQGYLHRQPTAFKGGVAPAPKLHLHVVGKVGVFDRHRRRGPGPRGYTLGKGPETEPHAFAVVIHRIVLHSEAKALGHVLNSESKARGNSRVVLVRSPVLPRSRDGNRPLPPRRPAQDHGHFHALAFGGGVARLRECRGHFESGVINRHHCGIRGSLDYAARKVSGGGSQSYAHAFAVVIHEVIQSGEGKAPERLRSAEGKARRNRVVVSRRPSLVGRRERNHNLPPRLLAQGHAHFHAPAFGGGVARLRECHGHGGTDVPLDIFYRHVIRVKPVIESVHGGYRVKYNSVVLFPVRLIVIDSGHRHFLLYVPIVRSEIKGAYRNRTLRRITAPYRNRYAAHRF